MPKVEALTAADAARRLATTTRTVNRRARDGTLPYIEKRPGRTGAYLFSAAQLDEVARAEGVVSVLELARELHPGDPENHGVSEIGRALFDLEVEPDTGVPPLLTGTLRRSAQRNACTDPECVAAAEEASRDE